MPTQKITGQTQLNPPIPTTTAINDFQVGDGAGNWIKNTLAQVVTTLRTALDSIYYIVNKVISTTPPIVDSDRYVSGISAYISPTSLISDIARTLYAFTGSVVLDNSGASSLLHTSAIAAAYAAAQNQQIPTNNVVGIQFSAQSYGSTTNDIIGIDGFAYNLAGIVTNIYGANYSVYVSRFGSGSSTATNAYGKRIRIIAQSVFGNATITNGYGAYIDIGAEWMGGGTPNIVNAYGIYLANFIPEDGYTEQLISNITQLFIEKPTNGVSTNYSIVSNGINWFLSGAATDVPMTIKGFAGQTAHLTEWQDSTGAVLSYIDAAGNFSGSASSGGVILRALTADLSIPDTGSMVVVDYFNVGSHALTLVGDACLQIL